MTILFRDLLTFSCWTKTSNSGHSELNARRSQRENEHANRIDRTYEARFQGVTQILKFTAGSPIKVRSSLKRFAQLPFYNDKALSPNFSKLAPGGHIGGLDNSYLSVSFNHCPRSLIGKRC